MTRTSSAWASSIIFLFSFQLVTVTKCTGTGYVDLTNNTASGPGFGFVFESAEATASGMQVLDTLLPDCIQAPLDSTYFYIYHCQVSVEAVVELGSTVPGFKYASDKSLTFTTPKNNSSLLLANAWNLSLHYETSSDCETDMHWATSGDDACVATSNSCEDGDMDRGGEITLTLSCGDYWTCSGCVLRDFFTSFHFTAGEFLESSMQLSSTPVEASVEPENCSEYFAASPSLERSSPEAAKWCRDGEYFPFKSRSNPSFPGNISLFSRCTPGSDTTLADGKSVLISHGWPTSSFDWAEVTAELETNGYRVCALDFAGFGFSDKPASFVYSMFDQAEALHEYATWKGLANFTLATHDMGDSIGLIFLQLFAKFHRLLHHVVINGSLKLSYANITAMQKLLLNDNTGEIVEKLIPPKLLAQSMSHELFSPPAGFEYGQELTAVFNYQHGVAIFHDTIQYLNERAEHEDEWLEGWGNSTAPCSLVWGELDPVATPALGDFLWENVLSNRSSAPARYVKVPDGNHYLQGDHPGTVADIILQGPPDTMGHAAGRGGAGGGKS